MNRSTLRRLKALKEKTPKDTGKWHTIMVASDEEEERETAVLKAFPKGNEGDNLMVIRLVAAGQEPTPDEISACELLP